MGKGKQPHMQLLTQDFVNPTQKSAALAALLIMEAD